jgi:hypothetical protein
MIKAQSRTQKAGTGKEKRQREKKSRNAQSSTTGSEEHKRQK